MWKTEALLKAIGKAAPRDCITESRLVEITGHDARSVEMSCLKLRKHGFLVKTERGCHKLTKAGRVAIEAGSADLRSGPKGKHIAARVTPGSMRERAWHAMRIKRKFSIPDLVMLIAEGGERDIESNLRKYLKTLTRIGYVGELDAREPGTALTSNGFKRYMLFPDKDTGPLAPIWRLTHGEVYDPNIERTFALDQFEARPIGRKAREVRA